MNHPLTILGSLILLLVCFSAVSVAQRPGSEEMNRTAAYDPALAKQLGADGYGMRHYVFALLKKGPNRNHDSVTAAQIQKGHLENIGRLAKEGKLLLAGPFLDDGDVRGIFVFNVTSVEEARELAETDPAIHAGRLAVELHPWYGSAAVMEINGIHSKISRNQP